MALGTSLVLTSGTYEPRGFSRYSLSTLDIDDPANEVKTSPGNTSKKTGLTSYNARRLWQIADADGDLHTSVVTVQFQISPGVTTSDVRSKVVDLSEILTEQHIKELHQGSA